MIEKVSESSSTTAPSPTESPIMSPTDSPTISPVYVSEPAPEQSQQTLQQVKDMVLSELSLMVDIEFYGQHWINANEKELNKIVSDTWKSLRSTETLKKVIEISVKRNKPSHKRKAASSRKPHYGGPRMRCRGM